MFLPVESMSVCSLPSSPLLCSSSLLRVDVVPVIVIAWSMSLFLHSGKQGDRNQSLCHT